jgi:hypothetical protein
MRRWLLVFLLFVLPLQFTWASAAGYCRHEQEVGARHVGHHSHEHAGDREAVSKAAQAAADDGDATALGLEHSDCSFCHLGCAKPFARELAGTMLALGQHFALAPPGPPALIAVDRIDRPNWQRIG